MDFLWLSGQRAIYFLMRINKHIFAEETQFILYYRDTEYFKPDINELQTSNREGIELIVPCKRTEVCKFYKSKCMAQNVRHVMALQTFRGRSSFQRLHHVRNLSAGARLECTVTSKLKTC
jgi:hypothetical protein